MPNLPVDMNSWERLACYPQGSFYPLSDGLSTQYHRITKPDFRLCSTCLSRSQAPFCLCTLRPVSVRPGGTFGRLRYILGGDRPSQTACLRWSTRLLVSVLESQQHKGGIQHRLCNTQRHYFLASHLSCAYVTGIQSQAAVKLHGVFLSSRG